MPTPNALVFALTLTNNNPTLLAELAQLCHDFEIIRKKARDNHSPESRKLFAQDFAVLKANIDQLNSLKPFSGKVEPYLASDRELRVFTRRWNIFIQQLYLAVFELLAPSTEGQQILKELQELLVFPHGIFPVTHHAAFNQALTLLRGLYGNHKMVSTLAGSQFETSIEEQIHGLSGFMAAERHKNADFDIRVYCTSDVSFEKQCEYFSACFAPYRKSADDFYIDPNNPDKSYLTIHCEINGIKFDFVLKPTGSKSRYLTSIDAELYLTGENAGKIKCANHSLLYDLSIKWFSCDYITTIYDRFEEFTKANSNEDKDKKFVGVAIAAAYFLKLMTKKMRDRYRLFLSPEHLRKLQTIFVNHKHVKLYFESFIGRYYENSKTSQIQIINAIKFLEPFLALPYNLEQLWHFSIGNDKNLEKIDLSKDNEIQTEQTRPRKKIKIKNVLDPDNLAKIIAAKQAQLIKILEIEKAAQKKRELRAQRNKDLIEKKERELEQIAQKERELEEELKAKLEPVDGEVNIINLFTIVETPKLKSVPENISPVLTSPPKKKPQVSSNPKPKKQSPENKQKPASTTQKIQKPLPPRPVGFVARFVTEFLVFLLIYLILSVIFKLLINERDRTEHLYVVVMVISGALQKRPFWRPLKVNTAEQLVQPGIYWLKDKIGYVDTDEKPLEQGDLLSVESSKKVAGQPSSFKS
jgi:hypothetical protein